MAHSKARTLALVTLFSLPSACGSNAPPPSVAPTASADPAASASSSSGVPAGNPHHHELHLAPPGPKVTVSLDGKSTDVVLADVPHEGSLAPLLTAVWGAAFPAVDLAPLQVDVFGSDGFHPSARPACARMLKGAELAAARIDVATHDLRFDGDSSLPGCYRVHGVVRIEASH